MTDTAPRVSPVAGDDCPWLSVVVRPCPWLTVLRVAGMYPIYAAARCDGRNLPQVAPQPLPGFLKPVELVRGKDSVFVENCCAYFGLDHDTRFLQAL